MWIPKDILNIILQKIENLDYYTFFQCRGICKASKQFVDTCIENSLPPRILTQDKNGIQKQEMTIRSFCFNRPYYSCLQYLKTDKNGNLFLVKDLKEDGFGLSADLADENGIIYDHCKFTNVKLLGFHGQYCLNVDTSIKCMNSLWWPFQDDFVSSLEFKPKIENLIPNTIYRVRFYRFDFEIYKILTDFINNMITKNRLDVIYQNLCVEEGTPVLWGKTADSSDINKEIQKLKKDIEIVYKARKFNPYKLINKRL